MSSPPAPVAFAAQLALLSLISFGGIPSILPGIHNLVVVTTLPGRAQDLKEINGSWTAELRNAKVFLQVHTSAPNSWNSWNGESASITRRVSALRIPAAATCLLSRTSTCSDRSARCRTGGLFTRPRSARPRAWIRASTRSSHRKRLANRLTRR